MGIGLGPFLLLLASLVIRGSEAEVAARALACNQIQLPAGYTAGQRGLFNPAAASHPQLGWCMVFRYDPCHTGMSPKCEHTFTRPHLSRLGSGALPDLSMAASTLVALRYSAATTRTIHAALKTNDTLIGDLRPFVWRNELHVSHWVYSEDTKPAQVAQAISKLDVERGVIELLRIFKVLGRTRVQYRTEKNWGFVEGSDGDLLIFYQVLPQILIARVSQSSGAVLLDSAYELRERHHKWLLDLTGLDASLHVHGSGHPQPWLDDEGEPEYILMVHQRKQKLGYAHWVLRMGQETRQVTHVSAGPVITWADYKLRGFKSIALIVGSFHMFSAPDAGVDHAVLRVFFGEGDKFSCSENVNLDSIQWVRLSETQFAPADF